MKYRLVIAISAVTMVALSAPISPASAAGDIATLAFAGDVHFADQLAVQGKPGGLASVPALLGDADLAMVNLETAIATHGSRQGKMYTFRAPSQVLNTLAEVGVDVVTQANNHAVDYGRRGLADAVAAKNSSPVAIVGLGANLADAIAPYRTVINGTDIAIFGIDAFRPLPAWRAGADSAGVAVWKWNRAEILRQMKSAADGGALVVAYVHWGVEYDTCPRASQEKIADDLIAAGAQVIVGAHPHVLQGVGYKSGALVDYSLGNFAWYGHAGTPSIVLRISVKDGHVLGFSTTPVMWDKRGLPHEVTGTKATKVAQVLAKRSRCDDLKSVP